MKKKVIPIVERTYDENKYRDLLAMPFAHRGVHDEYPENSLPAFEKAVSLNLGIELDVHLSKDGHLVVFHDDNLLHMAGADKPIRHLTYDEIKTYNLNNTNHTIPLLKDVFELVKGKVPILIEIKSNNKMKKLVPELKQLIDNYEGVVFVQSFNPFALRKCYKQMSAILRGQLSSFFERDKLSVFKKIAIKKLFFKNYSHIDFVSYNLSHLPNKYVDKVDVPVLAWTVRSEKDYSKAKNNANNIITDNVEVLN